MNVQGATTLKATDHVRPWELRQFRTHVVASDLAELRGVVDWSPAELRQRGAVADLSPTAVAMLLVLRTIRGLKGGKHGCGAQLSLEEWAELLGRSRRMVRYALNELEEAELVARFPQELPVHLVTAFRKDGPAGLFVDATGRTHARVECVAVTYLTPAGARLADAFGTTRALLAVPGAEQAERRVVSTGLLWRLWKTLRRALAAARCRVTAMAPRCTPYATRIREETKLCSKRTGVDNRPAGGRGAALKGRALPEGGPADHASGAPAKDGGTQASEPLGSAERAEPRQAAPPSRSGQEVGWPPPGAENAPVGLPEALRGEFLRCWRHTERVPTYRQPNRRFAGGDALVQTGWREVWSPLLTAARAWPARWRAASPTERRWLDHQFRPLRAALLARLLEHDQERARAELERQREAERERAATAAERERLLEWVAEAEAYKRRREAAGGA